MTFYSSDISHIMPASVTLLIRAYLNLQGQTGNISRQSISDYISKIEERKQLRDGGTDLMALREQLKKKKDMRDKTWQKTTSTPNRN